MDSNTPKIIEQLLKQHFHNKIFKEKYQEEKAEFIKGLEAEIGDELRTRINKIKGRLILFVGKSVKASEAAGRYAYCIKGHTILNFYSFSGKTDERIENILNDSAYDDGKDAPKYGKIVDCLSSGGAVFLGDLECHDRPLLKRLADGIRNVKYENYDKGMLLVSTTTDRDSVPEYFKELFEVIDLEPAKQSKPQTTPQTTPGSKDTPSEIIPFPTPEDAKWHEVDISFTDNDHVKIKVRDVVKTLHYSQMGFKHEQAVKYVKPWKTLRIFAMKNGIVTYQTMSMKKGKTVSSTNERLVTQDDVKELKKKLCIYFGIEVNPISYDEENAAYKASFKIRDDTGLVGKYSKKVNNSDNSDTETDKIQSYDSNGQDKFFSDDSADT